MEEGRLCAGCTSSTCWTGVTDLQTCSRITGDRLVQSSSATLLSCPLLQSTAGYLDIRSNTALTRIDLPSLSAVGGYLQIYSNNALTRIDLPSLSAVGGILSIGSNAAMTRINRNND